MLWSISTRGVRLTVTDRYASFWLHEFMKHRWIASLCTALMAVLANPLAIQACSVCITDANDPTTDAFNWSVFFLMAAPYTVVVSIAGALFFGYRRAAAKREQTETAEPLMQLAWHG